MYNRTVPERVNEFLVRRPGRAYCDICIQERLGLRWRQQVQLITATLAVTGAFRRESAICCTCNERKQVIRFENFKPSVFATSGLVDTGMVHSSRISLTPSMPAETGNIDHSISNNKTPQPERD